MAATCTTDKHTLASVDAFTFKHLILTLGVDFEARVLRGRAKWTVTVREHRVETLVLDTSAGLTVYEATVNGVPAAMTMRPAHAVFGTACAITLPGDPPAEGDELEVCLEYATAPESTALGWLPPEQTAGKEYPFVFSQCQAIHARAMLPCPDAPAAKFTYEAMVRVPQWATALMSAVALGAPVAATVNGEPTLTYRFEQLVPISSYLLALAVGQLRGVEAGPRTTVWAEPSIAEAAAWEFGDVESYIATAEELTATPYAWRRYDILCMPPSFPFGGMENPCLTFATPTLLAGDRSLANVIVHEVSHSWTGNLVTNHTWEHFWLNEGWTRWLECRIQAKMQSKRTSSAEGEALYNFLMQDARSHLAECGARPRPLQALLPLPCLVCPSPVPASVRACHHTPAPPTAAGSNRASRSAVKTFGADSPLTHLVPALDGIDPDDAFSAVPYEKGLALLNHLTDVVGGREAFEAFAREYIVEFKRRTLTSTEFRDFFGDYCRKKKVDASGVDWDGWFYTPGMPLVEGDFPDSLGERCVQLADRWLAEHAESSGSFDAAEYTDLPPQLKIHFLDTMYTRCAAAPSAPLTRKAIERMDQLYGLTASKNSEARLRWQRLCLLHRMDFIVPHVTAFLKEQGRMKFVRPLMRDLYEWEAQRSVALTTFEEWRENYHPICQKMLAQDLKVA